LTEQAETAMNSGFPAGRIALDRLRAGPVEWSGDLPDARGAWDLSEVEFASTPRLEYRAEPGGHGGVRVVGRLSVELELECRRCLESVRWPLQLDFDFRFDPSVRMSEEEGGVYALDPDTAEVDLARPLREELVLAVPEYAVCRDDCRGLCPTCGANRNVSDCDCTPTGGDPRWDVLKKLVADGRQGAAGPEEDNEVNGA